MQPSQLGLQRLCIQTIRSMKNKRNSKAAINALKPSYSTSHILNQPVTETIHSKMELNIKYPIYEKLQEEKNGDNKRQTYNLAKSSRDSRRLIEFKLNENSESTQNIINKDTSNVLISHKVEAEHSKHKFLYPKSDLTKRLITHKSEHALEVIQSKYGHNPGVNKPNGKTPSISVEKSSLHTSKGSRSDLNSRPKWQTSRNNPFPNYKVVKSIKHNVESQDKTKSDRLSGKFTKNGMTKPSQVKIYLKNEDE